MFSFCSLIHVNIIFDPKLLQILNIRNLASNAANSKTAVGISTNIYGLRQVNEIEMVVTCNCLLSFR